MAGIYYYLSGQNAVSREMTDALGLAYACDTGGPNHAAMGPGPDGKPGVVFVFAGPDGSMAPTALAGRPSVHWMEYPGNDGLWLGYDQADVPGPEDLVRSEQQWGHAVQLADGRLWTVPVARLVDGQPALPRRLSWDGTAWTEGEILERYASLFAAACRLWDALAVNGRVELDESCDVATSALAVNYRIGPAEISLLGLFDTESHAAVVKAMIDWPTVEALVKKGVSNQPSLEPGERDSCPDTDPAPPNS